MTEKSFIEYEKAIEFLLRQADSSYLREDLKEAGIRFVNNRWQIWIVEDEDDSE